MAQAASGVRRGDSPDGRAAGGGGAFDIKDLMQAKGIYFGCPPVGEAPFVAAFTDYHKRMHVLRTVPVAEQNRILKQFNTAMLTPDMVADVADPLAAVGLASLTAAERAGKGPFSIDLGAKHLADFERDFPNGVLKNNMRILMTVAFRALHQCGIRHHLCYHACDHLVKMMHDCGRLAKALKLDDRILLSAIEGLFHDALFTFKRGVDELNSSKLLWAVLSPFVATLLPADQLTFEAMIMAGIPGGTVPVPVKMDLGPDADADAIKAGRMGIKPLGELYAHCVPTADCAMLMPTHMAGFAMVGDIQQSAMPILDMDFPAAARPALSDDNPLLRLATEHVAAKYTGESAQKRGQRIHGILAKLAQSGLFLTENMRLYLSEEHHPQADMTAGKFAGAYRRRSIDGLTLDKDDALMLGRKVGGEKFFAGMNLHALLGSDGGLRALPLGMEWPCEIHAESWQDHIDIYNKVADALPTADSEASMTTAQVAILRAFVENMAVNGPGAYPDWAGIVGVIAPLPAAAVVRDDEPAATPLSPPVEQVRREVRIDGAAAPSIEERDPAGEGGDCGHFWGQVASALCYCLSCGCLRCCCSNASIEPAPHE